MNTRAFTLLEIVLTFILFSLVSVMIIPYYQSGVLTQHQPIERLQYSSILNDAMELIVRDYDASTKDSFALTTLSNNVTSFATYYVGKCALCSACTPTTNDNAYSLTPLTNQLLVTIECTNPSTGLSESLSHVFTEQN